MPNSPTTTSTRNFDLVDDAAIFIDDTFDSNMVRRIPGLLMSSPSAVVMLSPQRMPIDENGEHQGLSPSISQIQRAHSEKQRRNHLARCEKHHFEIEGENGISTAHVVKCEGTSFRDITNKRIPTGSSQKRLLFNNRQHIESSGLVNSTTTVSGKNSVNDNYTPKYERDLSASLSTIPPHEPSISFSEKTSSDSSTLNIKEKPTSITRNIVTIIGKDDNANHNTPIEPVESPPPKEDNDEKGSQFIVVEVDIDKNTEISQISNKSSTQSSQKEYKNDGEFYGMEETEVTGKYSVYEEASWEAEGSDHLDTNEYNKDKKDQTANLSDHYVLIEDYEKVVKDRNRYREMYRYQAQMCDDYYKRERETQEKLQSKIVELVAVSSRCEESKRFIRQMKREMLQCRERALPFHNKKMDDIRYEKNIKEKYEHMLNVQRDQFLLSEQDMKEELSSMEILLSDLKRATEMGKSTESLLRAAYQKNGHLYSELCDARNEWQKELDRRMELDSALEISRKNKHEWEVALSKERRRNFAREEELMQDTLDLQEEVISLREELAEMKIHATETLEESHSVSRRLDEFSDDEGDCEPNRDPEQSSEVGEVETQESYSLLKQSSVKATGAIVRESRRINDTDDSDALLCELILSSVHKRRGVTKKETGGESLPRPQFTTTCAKYLQKSKCVALLNRELCPRRVVTSSNKDDHDESCSANDAENERYSKRSISKSVVDKDSNDERYLQRYASLAQEGRCFKRTEQ